MKSLMHLSSFRGKWYSVLLFAALTTLLFVVVQTNPMRIAPQLMYDGFLQESEALIVGKTVADLYQKPMPGNAHLGFASINDFRYERKYLIQCLALVEAGNIGDMTVPLNDINDDNWSHGVAKGFAGFVAKRDDRIDSWVGRSLLLPDGTRRTITLVDSVDIYTNIYVDGPVVSWPQASAPLEVRLSGTPVDPQRIALTGNLSLYGIQGPLLSKIFAATGRSIALLNAITSVLFALTVVALALLYRRIFSLGFAVVFLMTIALSPWMVSFAKNLFWLPFTWFVPAVFSAWYFLAKSKSHRLAALAMLYLAFTFKCLAGYEYISSIILLATAPWIYDFCNPQGTLGKKQAVKGGFLICMIGTLGFLTALLMHADLRGVDILDGLKNIYEQDVKRRTYGDAGNFDPSYQASLLATPWSVVQTYVMNWRTDFLYGLKGDVFAGLSLLSVLVVAFRGVVGDAQWKTQAGLLLAFVFVPLSWFVLAKAHSAVHTHVNFVLWYFGFAAVILYVPLSAGHTAWQRLTRRAA
jgi:hypothetical protein